MKNFKYIGKLNTWQNDFRASSDEYGTWSISWTYISDNPKFTPPDKCPHPLFQKVHIDSFDRTILQEGVYSYAVTYKQLYWATNPTDDKPENENYPNIPQEPSENQEESNNATFSYSKTIGSKDLLEHKKFKTLANDLEQLKAIEYVKSARCDLRQLNGELKRLSHNDDTFEKVTLGALAKQYLNYWQRGIESYYEASASYSETNGGGDSVLESLKAGDNFTMTSQTTSLNGKGQTETTISYSSYTDKLWAN